MRTTRRRKNYSVKAGKAFENEISLSLKYYQREIGENFFFRRMADTYDYARNWCPRCRHPFTSSYIAAKNPSDFYVIYGGRTIFLEAKSSQAPRYNLAWIKPHQVNDLLAIEQAGGEGYFLISYRASTMRKRHPSETPVFDTNKAWYLRPETVRSLLSSDRRSVKWDVIDSLGEELHRTGRRWDMYKLFFV